MWSLTRGVDTRQRSNEKVSRGHVSHPTFFQSYSYFSVSMVRDGLSSHEVLPSSACIQTRSRRVEEFCNFEQRNNVG